MKQENTFYGSAELNHKEVFSFEDVPAEDMDKTFKKAFELVSKKSKTKIKSSVYLSNGKVVIASTKKEAINKVTADSLDGKPYDKLNDFEKLMINISGKFNDDDDGELLSLSEYKAKFSLQTALFLNNYYTFDLEISYDDMEDKYDAILYGYLVSKTSTNKILSRSLYLNKNNIMSKINKVNKCITIFREHLINASKAFNTI